MSEAALVQLLWPVGVGEDLPSTLDPARILGELRFGADQGRAGELPCLHVRTPTLWPAQAWRALWVTDQAVMAGTHGRVRYRYTDQLLFGTVAVDEAGLTAADGVSALQQAAHDAYRELFAALEQAGFPALLRVWNYLPRINEVEDGVERYRQFNIGRQDAFAACGRELSGQVPAASALGVAHGALEIGFFATRGALDAIENPRQVSAYHYPSDYGPRSPTFSRATVARLPGQDLLFISGTASIIGHETVHGGDVVAQTRETLTNIGTVHREAVRVATGMSGAAGDLCYLAYVRSAADLGSVQAELHATLGTDAQVCYVQADVCRADLLVEIEASGGHPTQGLFER